MKTCVPDPKCGILASFILDRMNHIEKVRDGLVSNGEAKGLEFAERPKNSLKSRVCAPWNAILSRGAIH